MIYWPATVPGIEKKPRLLIAIATRIITNAAALKISMRLCFDVSSLIFFEVILAMVIKTIATNIMRLCSDVQYRKVASFMDAPLNETNGLTK